MHVLAVSARAKADRVHLVVVRGDAVRFVCDDPGPLPLLELLDHVHCRCVANWLVVDSSQCAVGGADCSRDCEMSTSWHYRRS